MDTAVIGEAYLPRKETQSLTRHFATKFGAQMVYQLNEKSTI
jgi:hypothetical protein